MSGHTSTLRATATEFSPNSPYKPLTVDDLERILPSRAEAHHETLCLRFSMRADQYATALHSWCHSGLRWAKVHRPDIYEVHAPQARRYLPMLLSRTATANRESVCTGLLNLAPTLFVLRKATLLDADDADDADDWRADRAEFCHFVWRSPEVVPEDELNLWDIVVVAHCGRNISDIASRYRPPAQSKL